MQAGFYLLGGGEEASPPKVSLKKKSPAISNKDLFDDDFKEAVKVTNVQKCDFSQSWTLYFQNFPGEHAPGPLESQKIFSRRRVAQNFFSGSTPPPPLKQKS